MAVLDYIIEPQNFEIVNERIGFIAKLELENQKQLQGFTEPVNVYLERQDRFNDDEIVMINTMYDGTNSNEDTQASSQGNVNYNIDVYVSGKSKPNYDGGRISALRLHKFIGMLRHIFSATQYKTLGFTPGMIGNVTVDNIQIASTDPENTGYVSMGRLVLKVRISEGQPLVTGTLINESVTGVKLDLTEKGYQFKLTE